MVRNPNEELGDRTLGRVNLPDHLIRVNDAAKRSRQTRFKALLHHVDVEALERAFRRLGRKAAPGVDGTTVETYEGKLSDNLRELCDRVHSGRYKPLPVRRTYIPKADGGTRPLGILALEDKIVQGAVAEVVSAIYEADFLDCSYGFRPGQSCKSGSVGEAAGDRRLYPTAWSAMSKSGRFSNGCGHSSAPSETLAVLIQSPAPTAQPLRHWKVRHRGSRRTAE